MKGLFRAIIAGLISLNLGLTPMTAFASVPEARQAAEQSLGFYKQHFRDEAEKFGFPSKNALESATLGEGLQVFALSESAVLDEEFKSLALSIAETNHFVFIVNGAGKAVSRTTVLREGATFVRAGFGGLGADLAKGLSQIPKEAQGDIKLVRYGRVEFLAQTTPGKGKEQVVYFGAHPIAGIQSHRVYDWAEFHPLLRQWIVSRNSAESQAVGGIPGISQQAATSSGQWWWLLVASLAVLTPVCLILLRRKSQSLQLFHSR